MPYKHFDQNDSRWKIAASNISCLKDFDLLWYFRPIKKHIYLIFQLNSLWLNFSLYLSVCGVLVWTNRRPSFLVINNHLLLYCIENHTVILKWCHKCDLDYDPDSECGCVLRVMQGQGHLLSHFDFHIKCDIIN